MAKRRAILGVVFILGILRSPCLLDAELKLRIAVDPTFPPMESVDASGQMVGLDIDMIRAAARAGGFEVTFVSIPWDAIFSALSQGSVDAIVSSVTIFTWRKATMDFSMPYYYSEQFLLVPKKAVETNSLEDLRGEQVGVVRGSVASSFLNEGKGRYGVVCKEYDNYDEPYYDLTRGLLSGTVSDSLGVALWLEQPDVAEKIRVAGKCPFKEQIAVAVRKGNKAALSAIDKGLKAITDSGQLAQIIDKWMK